MKVEYLLGEWSGDVEVSTVWLFDVHFEDDGWGDFVGPFGSYVFNIDNIDGWPWSFLDTFSFVHVFPDEPGSRKATVVFVPEVAAADSSLVIEVAVLVEDDVGGNLELPELFGRVDDIIDVGEVFVWNVGAEGVSVAVELGLDVLGPVGGVDADV